LRGLDTAVEFIRKYNGALDDRIRGLLVPREVETSTVELLEKTLSFADELKVPMATHAAYSVLEFHDIVREHQMTPIEVLDKIGMLRTTLNIGQGNFITVHSKQNY
jgi:cytosine/adenosine deaminase-related metal-dependent hydrolase